MPATVTTPQVASDIAQAKNSLAVAQASARGDIVELTVLQAQQIEYALTSGLTLISQALSYDLEG